MPKLSEARKSAILIGMGASLILIAAYQLVDFFVMERNAIAAIAPAVELIAAALFIAAGLRRSTPELPTEDFH